MIVETIDRKHPALECNICEGHGFIDVEFAASPVAIEPSVARVLCSTCGGNGGWDETECWMCDSTFDAVGRECGVEKVDKRLALICPDCLEDLR